MQHQQQLHQQQKSPSSSSDNEGGGGGPADGQQRQVVGCVTPVISLQKLKEFFVQPKFRAPQPPTGPSLIPGGAGGPPSSPVSSQVSLHSGQHHPSQHQHHHPINQHHSHGPGGNSLEEGVRGGGLESSQLHGIYGNHGNRANNNSASNSPPVSSSSSGSMLVVPQPISASKGGNPLNSGGGPPTPTQANGTGRKYQCKMCPQIFVHKSAMQHHAREMHRGELKPHQCQQCLKSFSSNHQLTQHIRIHTGEKPYKCSYCDRRFKQLSHVQQHTRLHTGERPYKCHLPDCGRAFIQLSNLQQHLRNHDSQMERAKNRPFCCNICGKGFASESSLRTHRAKQHAALIGGASSQSCPICHKICVNGEALMEHMRLAHKDPNQGAPTGKRRTTNHPCPICGKTYVNEGSLRKHISSHPEAAAVAAATPLRMWPCSVCQSVFTQEAGLLHHMENMRMDPKHQFAAQYVLSRAAAERREKQGPSSSGSSSAALSAIGAPGTSSDPGQQLMICGSEQQSNGSQPGPSGTVMTVGILPLTAHHQQHP